MRSDSSGSGRDYQTDGRKWKRSGRLTDISFTKSEKRNMIPESRQEQSTGGYDHERSKKDSSRQDRRRRN